LASNQIIHQRRYSVDLILGPAVFDRCVAALDVAGFAQALVECAYIALPTVGRFAAEEPDHRDGLLRTRCERPRGCRAAEKRDELATLYVEHRGLPPLCVIAAADWPVRPVCRRFSLPQGGRQVLGAELKCSESKRGGLPLMCL